MTTWIKEPRQINAIASLVRQNILDRLESTGPHSIKELAESLDVAADSLYYHMRLLQEVGLIREVGTRKTSRRDEAVYEITIEDWHIAYEPENLETVRNLTRAMLRQANRDFDKGSQMPHQAMGDQRDLWSLRLEARLSKSDLQAMNHHLEAIIEIMRRPSQSPHQRLHALTWIMAPIEQNVGDDPI